MTKKAIKEECWNLDLELIEWLNRHLKVYLEYASKNINQLITKDKFVDKPLEQYLYASLSQPPIRILDKRDSLDELDYIVECPNCHSAVCYGTDIFMISGHLYCSNNGCREEVITRYNSRYNKK